MLTFLDWSKRSSQKRRVKRHELGSNQTCTKVWNHDQQGEASRSDQKIAKQDVFVFPAPEL